MNERILKMYAKKYQLPVNEADYKYAFVPYCGESLFMQMFTPKKTIDTILLLHGFFDHTGTNAAFIRSFVLKGYQIIAFDLPGHGFSGGERFQVDSFDEYQVSLKKILEEAANRNITRMHAVGHSTGGAIIAEALLDEKYPQIEKASLVAPLLRSNQWWLSKVSTALFPTFVDEVPRIFRKNKKEAAVMKKLKQDPLQGKTISVQWVKAMFDWEKQLLTKGTSHKPIQILQGTQDYTVDAHFNMESYGELFPHSDRILIDDGTHHLLNERPAQRQIVYSLISKYLHQ